MSEFRLNRDLRFCLSEAMLIIHHLVQSCSERIVWLAEELGLDYELKVHRRDPVTLRSPPELRDASPLGKSPLIEHKGLKVHESAVIVEYILDQFADGRLQPARGSEEWNRYRYWMHASESTVKVPIIVNTLTQLGGVSNTEGLDAFIGEEYRTMFGYIESQLTQYGHIAGREFSAADLMLWYVLRIASNANMPGQGLTTPIHQYAAILDYMQRIEARPACVKALEICNRGEVQGQAAFCAAPSFGVKKQ